MMYKIDSIFYKNLVFYVANDVELIFLILTFPANSSLGALQCIDVMTFSDDIFEPTEVLFFAIFPLFATNVTTYEIDDTRMVAQLSICKNHNT